MRRATCAAAAPNAGHVALAEINPARTPVTPLVDWFLEGTSGQILPLLAAQCVGREDGTSIYHHGMENCVPFVVAASTGHNGALQKTIKIAPIVRVDLAVVTV
jgi:hypothetical protein